MSVLLLVPLLAVLGATALAVLVVVLVRATPGSALPDTAAAARRHAVVGGVLAAAAGVGVVPLWIGLGWRPVDSTATLAATMAVTPAVAGLVHTIVLAVTELTWPRPQGAVRVAGLSVRGVRDVAPALLRKASWGALGAVFAVCAVGVLTGTPDGHTVRNVDGPVSYASGPYPGWAVAVPAAVALLVLAVAVEAALRLVVGRPAVSGADDATDSALRRASAHRLLRGATWAYLATAGPCLSFGGIAAQRVLDGGPLHWLALAAALLGPLVCLAAFVVLCVPAPRVPRPVPAPADDPVPA